MPEIKQLTVADFDNTGNPSSLLLWPEEAVEWALAVLNSALNLQVVNGTVSIVDGQMVITHNDPRVAELAARVEQLESARLAYQQDANGDIAVGEDGAPK